jgi:hypothetical protein
MKTRYISFALSTLCFFLVAACNKPADFTGFWKTNCTDAFGIQIKKQTGSLFSVSFCGPGGCFAPGQWMPNSPIVGDPKYRVLSPTTIEIGHGEGQGWTRYTRCTTDTNPVLDYATMPEMKSEARSAIAAETSPQNLRKQTEEDPLFAVADKTKPAWKGPDRSVYVVTQNHYAEGFTPEGDTAKFGDLIAIEIFNPRGPSAEENPVYEVGERLSLFVGGQLHGDVRINKVVPLQCDSSAALVSTDPSFHLTKDTMALASNSDKIRSHSSAQHQASELQSNYARQLAMDEFRKHALPATLAKNIKIDRLVVTRLNGTDSDFLVGSLSLVTKGARHDVFLIAKIVESSARAEFARYHETSDLEDGKDSEDVSFVDQLDLDGDGLDEIVVEVTGYENEEFAILHRSNGSWAVVHLGGQGGC